MPKKRVLLVDDMALDRLLTKGVVFGACNIALQVQSKMLANIAFGTMAKKLAGTLKSAIQVKTVIVLRGPPNR